MVCARSRKVVRKFCASICIKTLGGARYAQAQRKVPIRNAQGGHFYTKNFEQRSYIYIKHWGVSFLNSS